LIGPFVAAVLEPARLLRFPRISHGLTVIGTPLHLGAIPALGVLLLGVFTFKGVLAYSSHHRILAFAFRVRESLIKRLMRAYLGMPYQFYLDRNSSTLVQSIVINTKVATDDLLIPVMRSISDLLVLVLIAAFLWVLNPGTMTMFVAVVGLAFAVYARIVRPRMRIAGKQAAVANEAIIRGVNQAIGGIKDIRILSLETPFMRLVGAAAEASTGSQTRFYSYLVLPRYLMETVVVLFILALALVTLTRGGGAADLVAMLAVFATAGIRALPAMAQVSSSLASMSYSSYTLTALYKDLRAVEPHSAAASPVRADNPVSSGATPSAGFGQIELQDLAFTYPSAKTPAISGVSLVIRRGTSVGFIGESGSGKTTLVDLLLGLHRLHRGRILLDGLDLDEIGWECWTSHVAYIPQTVFIIDDTLRRNVALGASDEDIDAHRLDEALGMAQLRDMVARLPNGLDTVLGERGGRLSGGERQRIALARAFYHNRDVLVFDEATSALDMETEREVIKVIESLHGLKTVIVIAHRLATVSGCDVVHRLSRGRLVGSGTLEELARA
jgi:ABC-type multidrug transport system fused ATPase/permease subunit